jgi:hypothetical protein
MIDDYNKGFTNAHHRDTERTEDERTETTIAQKKICFSFQMLVIR